MKKHHLAPVILFVYNRVSHTKDTINSLLKNELSELTEVIVYSDGAASAEARPMVDQVRLFLKTVKGFKSLTVIEREANWGLAKNIISGVDECFKNYERVIVLEDDLSTAPGFLQYMNDALDFYEYGSAFVISGYVPPISISKSYEFDSFMAPRNCSWGWAIWKNRWNTIDWDVSNFDHFIESKQQRFQFNRGGNDLSMMLLKQMVGKLNSWSIRFTYSMHKQGLMCVYPVKSLVGNNGIDGSGTHMKSSVKYKTNLSDEIKHYSFCPDNTINHSIVESMRKFYNTSFYRRCLNSVKIWIYNSKKN